MEVKIIAILLIFIINSISSQDINFNKIKAFGEIRRLAGSYDINIGTLHKFASHKNLLIRIQVARNSRCPRYVLERLSREIYINVKETVALNPRTPIYILIKLSNEKNEYIRNNLAYNPNIPLSVLMKLARDSSYYVRKTIVEHPNVSKEIIKILIEDIDEEVRLLARATNPDASEEELAELSKNKESFVRSQVAKNKKTPLVILYELAKDEQLHVRCDVAKCTNNSDLLELLSNDKNDLVLEEVANNKYSSQKTLIKLIRGESYNVKEIAIKNPNTTLVFLEQLAKEGSNKHGYDICYTIMERPDVSKEIIKILLKDREKKVRFAAKAIDSDTSETDLIELSKTDEEFIKILVIENEKTPFSALYWLAMDEKFIIRRHVAKKAKDAKLLEFLSHDEDVIVVEEVANNIHCPEEILARLAKDSRYDIRWAVSMNPSTPKDVLLKEFNSDHDEIKENVKNNLKNRLQKKK